MTILPVVARSIVFNINTQQPIMPTRPVPKSKRGRKKKRSKQPAYPYTYDITPWLYRLIQFSTGGGSTATMYSVENILTALKGYLTSTSTDLQFKINKVEIWSIAAINGPDSGKYPNVELDVYSTIPRINDVATGGGAPFYNIIKKKRDTGTLNIPAKVSYRWPEHLRIPLGEESNSFLFATAGTPSVVYVHVCFRIGGEAAPIEKRFDYASPVLTDYLIPKTDLSASTASTSSRKGHQGKLNNWRTSH